MNEVRNERNELSSSDLLSLIRSEPDADAHIHYDQGEWWVTNEWLCGGFAGRAFTGKTQEEAADKLIEYLNAHIGHDSWVGQDVTKSGWPNLKAVKSYLVHQRDEDSIEDNIDMNHVEEGMKNE